MEEECSPSQQSVLIDTIKRLDHCYTPLLFCCSVNFMCFPASPSRAQKIRNARMRASTNQLLAHPFGSPHSCLPCTQIACWPIIHRALLHFTFFLYPKYNFPIFTHIYIELCFWCNTITTQEVLVKWEIMTRLEETGLISSI